MTENTVDIPTYSELMAEKNRYHEDANRYLIQLGRVEEELADLRARIDKLKADAVREVLRVEILRQLEHVAGMHEGEIVIDCAGGFASLNVEKLADAVAEALR